MSMDSRQGDFAHQEAELSRIKEQLARVGERIPRVLSGQIVRLGLQSRGKSSPRGTSRHAAFARLFSDEERAKLERGLNVPRPRARGMVALALSEVGGEETAKLLAEKLETETDPTARQYIVQSLGNLGGPEAARVLEREAQYGETLTGRTIAAHVRQSLE